MNMNLQQQVQESISRFEATTPEGNLRQVQAVHDLFEEMVAKGLVERPKYNLAPISTLPAKVSVGDFGFSAS